MNRSRLWWAVALAGISLNASCGEDCGPFEVQTIEIMDGEYLGTLQEGAATSFPHVAGSNFALTVDRSMGLVEVRYMKDGEQVLERWRITQVVRR